MSGSRTAQIIQVTLQFSVVLTMRKHGASTVCIEKEMTAFEIKQEHKHLDQLQSQGPEYLRILR